MAEAVENTLEIETVVRIDTMIVVGTKEEGRTVVTGRAVIDTATVEITVWIEAIGNEVLAVVVEIQVTGEDHRAMAAKRRMLKLPK